MKETTVQQPTRDTGLDVARGIALAGIVAAHTLNNNTSLLFVLGNGIAPLMFALLTGVTMARTRIPSIKSALITGAFLFALGTLLGLTSTPVIPVLQTLGVIHVTTTIIARTGHVITGIIGLVAVISGPFIQAALTNISTGPYAPGFHGEWDGSLQSLLLNGTYPLITWWGVPLIGYAIGRINFGAATGVLALGVPIALFSAWHMARGSVFDNFGDVSHLLFPVSDSIDTAAYVHTLPYGHTGSLLAALIAASSSMGIIWIVNSVNTGLAGTFGANTLTGYCVNVLLCISPDTRGGYVEWLVQLGIIAGVIFFSVRYLGKGPVEWVRGGINSVIAPRQSKHALTAPQDDRNDTSEETSAKES